MQTILDKDSNIGKAIINNPVQFAKMLDAQSRGAENNSKDSSKLTPQHLMQSMTLPLLSEMVNVGKYSEERAHNKDGSRTMWQTIKGVLSSVVNTVKNIVGKGLNESKFEAAMQDLSNITKPVDKNIKINDTAVTKPLEQLTNSANKRQESKQGSSR